MERTLRVEGMHCEGCAHGVRRFLRSEPGVEAAAVSHGDGRATVTVTADADLDALCAALSEMGYDAAPLD